MPRLNLNIVQGRMESFQIGPTFRIQNRKYNKLEPSFEFGFFENVGPAICDISRWMAKHAATQGTEDKS